MDETPDDLLFDFLHKAKATARFNEIRTIFNCPFDLSSMLTSFAPRLQDLLKVFDSHTSPHAIQPYVHFSDVVGVSSTSKSNASHRWRLLSDYLRFVQDKCKWHKESQCLLV